MGSMTQRLRGVRGVESQTTRALFIWGLFSVQQKAARCDWRHLVVGQSMALCSQLWGPTPLTI